MAIVEKKLKQPSSIEHDAWTEVLADICLNHKASEKLKASVVRRAKDLESADSGIVRVNAISALFECDPKGGRAEAQRFVSDKDEMVSRHARSLVSENK
jgi:hypothetical protein